MKLTSADVDVIRARRAAGEKLIAIALDFGVCETTISDVARGVTHAGKRPGRPHTARPREEDVIAELRGFPCGRRLRDIAARVYGAPTRAKVKCTSVVVHALKCRGLVRRVRCGVWALTSEAA